MLFVGTFVDKNWSAHKAYIAMQTKVRHRTDIVGVFVHPNYRGRGIASNARCIDRRRPRHARCHTNFAGRHDNVRACDCALRVTWIRHFRWELR